MISEEWNWVWIWVWLARTESELRTSIRGARGSIRLLCSTTLRLICLVSNSLRHQVARDDVSPRSSSRLTQVADGSPAFEYVVTSKHSAGWPPAQIADGHSTFVVRLLISRSITDYRERSMVLVAVWTELQLLPALASVPPLSGSWLQLPLHRLAATLFARLIGSSAILSTSSSPPTPPS